MVKFDFFRVLYNILWRLDYLKVEVVMCVRGSNVRGFVVDIRCGCGGENGLEGV